MVFIQFVFSYLCFVSCNTTICFVTVVPKDKITVTTITTERPTLYFIFSAATKAFVHREVCALETVQDQIKSNIKLNIYGIMVLFWTISQGCYRALVMESKFKVLLWTLWLMTILSRRSLIRNVLHMQSNFPNFSAGSHEKKKKNEVVKQKWE